MAVLSPYTYLQWFDDTGSPLSAGKIYTYIAGTTTPKTTYSDSSGVTPNTNPIILDAGGRAQIWLQSAAYKFVVKTSGGADVETIDNVIGGNSAGSAGFCATIAELRSLPSGSYTFVTVYGYADESDGGEGNFYWNDVSTAAEDYGIVIVPSSNPAAGRWIRYVTDGKYKPSFFSSAATFFAWCTAQTTNKSIAINKDLNLSSNTYVLNQYIDIVEFNNNAKITTGTLTIGKISAMPLYKVFDDTVSILFAASATQFGNTVWFGGGSTGKTKLIAAFPSGGIKFIDDQETDPKLRLKYIHTDGTIYNYALFNQSETFE